MEWNLRTAINFKIKKLSAKNTRILFMWNYYGIYTTYYLLVAPRSVTRGTKIV